MKKKLVSKFIAGMLTAAMVLGMAACGDQNNDGGDGSVSDSGSQGGGSDNSDNPGSSNEGGDNTEAPMSITVSVNGNNPFADEGTDPTFLKLVNDLNEYTNMNVTWDIRDDVTYPSQLALRYAAQDVADVMKVWVDAVFWSACVGGSVTYDNPVVDADGNPVMEDVLDAEGNPVLNEDGSVQQVQKTESVTEVVEGDLFWDLTDYIDDYDNLASIPEAVRAAASYNGRMYFIPLSRTLARNGVGFRKDWCEKLNLAFWNKIEAGEDPTWQDFYDMLYAFTYNDPDGNGVADTCGLLLDQWIGKDLWNNMLVWFGVPNEWGVDENGDLVYKIMTDEYITALKAFRELYADGLINDGTQSGVTPWWEVGPGSARNELQNHKGGANVQTLDTMRKVETTFEANGDTTDDDPLWYLTGYVTTESGNYEPYCYPTTGFANGVAVSKKNIKTEDELRRVLQFINDLSDGYAINLIEYGWEGVTYELDEDGYVSLWLTGQEENDPKLEAAGVADTKYRNGFEQSISYFTAEANARPVTTATNTTAIYVRENQLYVDDIPYCVTNYGASYYLTDTYVNDGAALDAIIYGTDLTVEGQRGFQLAYIMGEIDDAGLEAAIQQWWNAGGKEWTEEINAAYHAAGN